MDILENNCYNKENKYKYLSMLTISDLKELSDYCKGNILMEKYMNRIKVINEGFVPFVTKEEDEIMIRNTYHENGRREGKAEGIKEGKAEGIKEGKAEGIKEGKAEGEDDDRCSGRIHKDV